MLSYMFFVYSFEIHKNLSILRWSNFPELVEKEQSNLPSTGLIINRAVRVKHLYHVHNKSQTIQFWILKAVLLWKTIYMLVCPKSKENILECNNQLELSVYNMWCSYMVLTNPHMKPRIEFIIMKIFKKIVKICPKSPALRYIYSPLWLICGHRELFLR